MEIGLDAAAQRQQYQEYRRRIDVRQVLDHYGAENCREIPGKNGTTEIMMSCLIDRVDRHHANGDANASAAMNVDTKLYTCYSGGWSGDILNFVAKMEGRESLMDVLPSLGQFLTNSTVDDAKLFIQELEMLMASATVELTTPLPYYSDRVLAPWSAPHPYLHEERGLTAEAVALLRIGFDAVDNRIVFPHFVGGRLVGWQKRALPDRPGRWEGTKPQWPKYRSSPGMPKSSTLYGYDLVDHDQPLIVVESPASVAMAHTLGVPNVVATFGAKTSDAQVRLMRDFPRVYLWYDRDEAGLSGATAVSRRLWNHVDTRAVLPDPDMDLADYRGRERVQEKLEHDARPVCLMSKDWTGYTARHGR